MAGPLLATPPVDGTVDVVGGAVVDVGAAVGGGGAVVVAVVGVVVGGATTGAVVGLVFSGAPPASCGEPAASAPVAHSTSTLAAMVAASAGREVTMVSVRAGQSGGFARSS